MTSTTPETTHSDSPDPKVQKWLQDFQIHNQHRQPINPSHLIIENQPLKNLDEPQFQSIFLQTMSQGVTLDDAGNPHFFHPKTFLENTAQRRIFRPRVEITDFTNGLNSIFLFKNLPENRLNLDLQQSAKTAAAEYLDPELFAGNFTQDSDLAEIFEHLSPDALEDPDLMDLFNAAHEKRQVLAEVNQDITRERARTRARKTAYNPAVDYTPNPESFKVHPNTTVDQILTNLKNSPNRAGFERINALKKWGDFIQENIHDPHYEEKVVSFGASSAQPQYSTNDTYAVIAFDYAGRRCMIAESCGSGGANSTAAAMKIWRSEPENANDKQGWLPVFAASKSAAKDLCQTLRHSDFAAELDHRDPENEDRIIEAEDRMFRSAFHYFETGELLGGGKSAATELDRLIGPEFRRPNP